MKKELALFLANSGGVYPARPSLVYPLPPETSTLFLAECNGAAPREIVLADAAGATVLSYSQEKLDVLAQPRFVSLLPSGSKEPLFLKETALDLDADGIEEWLLPMPSGYSLRTMDKEIALLPCDVISEIRRIESTYITHRLPAYQAFALEGKKGVAFLSDEFADFTYGTDWSQHERFRIPRNLEEKWEAASKMEDINCDGFPDLLVTQTKGTINLQVMTQIYVATTPFKYPGQPTATYTNKGGIASPALEDIDGDGKLDLILVHLPFGVKTIINYFVRGKLAVDAHVYLYRDGFKQQPDYTTTLTLDAPEGRERVAYTLGDFSGDGRKDVAFGTGVEALVVQRGEPEKFVESKPWLTLNVPSFGTARPHDLNGNPAQDIVLFHPSGDNSKRIEVIVF
ncbi:MAG: VCBS repeat-containing protein [Candidatus Hydrogenedentes bacterium]|nr:VCBS repeat-containing protein [Candidatus Hydrogenedentota bacterium]